jgi:hypothetical protein
LTRFPTTRNRGPLALIYSKKKNIVRPSYLGAQEIKFCILGYLYTQLDDGDYREKILLHLPRTQAPDRLKRFLDDLTELGKVESSPPRDSRREGKIIYKITESGKRSVDKYISADYRDVSSITTKKAAQVDLDRWWNNIKRLIGKE